MEQKERQVKEEAKTVKPCSVWESMGCFCIVMYAFGFNTAICSECDLMSHSSLWPLTLIHFTMCGWLSDSPWVILRCTCQLMSRMLRDSRWHTLHMHLCNNDFSTEILLNQWRFKRLSFYNPENRFCPDLFNPKIHQTYQNIYLTFNVVNLMTFLKW